MPTTRLKNIVYRAILPFAAPSCPSHPVSEISGHKLVYIDDYEKLLRKHHVLGSDLIIESGGKSSQICSFSSDPAHLAFPGILFRVASLTKTATAVLVMRLADTGIISIDVPVSSYLPSGTGMENISIRHLLSHTSGIIDPPDLEKRLENNTPFPEVLPSVRSFEPGKTFHYSNLGYGLIGCVLESVFNEPVSEIFRKKLFDPLQMNATLEGCHIPGERIMPVARIMPYRRGSDLLVTRLGSVPLKKPDCLRHYGHTAGSMYTDAASMQKLLHAIMQDDSNILSDYARREMKREHASYGRLSPTLSYGLGLLRIKDHKISDSIIYGHQGFAYGCADGAFWEENTGRMIIMLNGGCSEARSGRLGLANRDFMTWAFRKELPAW